MPKVSIIMPTYNVEQYLEQCLDSVINQTLKDIEIICVDDGSPDNCGKIIDEYAIKDPRIKAIHQENGGYGKAVNAGIEAATGEYIGIVETDDFIDPTMYEKLYEQAKKFDADICKCGFNRYNQYRKPSKIKKPWIHKQQNIERFPEEKSFSVLEYPQIINFHASIWSNIYTKELLKNIKVNTTKGASYQDFPFMVETTCKAKKIAVIHEYLYNWRVEPNQSSSTTSGGKKTMVMVEQCMECKRIIKEYGFWEQLKEEFYHHAHTANKGFYSTIDWEYKREYFSKLRELFGEIKDDANFTFKYFEPKEKRFVVSLLKNNFFKTIGFREIKHLFVRNIKNKNYVWRDSNARPIP